MKRTTLICTLAAGALAVAMPRPASAASPSDGTNLVSRLTESVKDNWGKVSAWCSRSTALQSEMEQLPDYAWWPGRDKDDCRKRIHETVLKIRNVLLSTNAQKIMARVDDIDKRIAEIDSRIHKENARGVFEPTKGDDVVLRKLREKRSRLVCEREGSVRVVLGELSALGLRLSGGAEQVLFMVDARDLIDAVIVSKSIGIVVSHLRTLMSTSDVAMAKRYFGMYAVMVDVQKSCFDIYLEKSRTGEWREKLTRLESEAITLRQDALLAAKDMAFSEQQRAAFARNADVNETTLKAIAAYGKILSQHEAVIKAKADEAAKMLLVAEHSYKTVAVTDEFLSLIKSNQDSFEALLELQLPPIEVFNDAALLAEFAAITRKLEEK